MAKNILYILLAILGVALFQSCDGGKDGSQFEIEGRWNISERTFICSDTMLQKRVRYLFKESYLPTKDGEYFIFENAMFTEGYTEREYITETESILFDMPRLTGAYLYDKEANKASMSITNIGSQWNFDLDVTDLNNDILYVKQKMGSENLHVFLKIYLTSFESVKDGVTAEWITKARKEAK